MCSEVLRLLHQALLPAEPSFQCQLLHLYFALRINPIFTYLFTKKPEVELYPPHTCVDVCICTHKHKHNIHTQRVIRNFRTNPIFIHVFIFFCYLLCSQRSRNSASSPNLSVESWQGMLSDNACFSPHSKPFNLCSSVSLL